MSEFNTILVGSQTSGPCQPFTVTLSEPKRFTLYFLPQLGFEINCGTDNKCVDQLKVDFNFTRWVPVTMTIIIMLTLINDEWSSVDSGINHMHKPTSNYGYWWLLTAAHYTEKQKKKKPEKHGFMTFFKNEKHLGESKTLLQQFSSFQGKSYSNFCMSYR